MNEMHIIKDIHEMGATSLSPEKFEALEDALIWICKARNIDSGILHPDFRLLEPRRERILREGMSLLQDIHGRYADLNLSFADNWYSNVEEYFLHELPKVKLK